MMAAAGKERQLNLSDVAMRAALSRLSGASIGDAAEELQSQIDTKIATLSNAVSGPLSAFQNASSLDVALVASAAAVAVGCCVAIVKQKNKAERQEESFFDEIKNDIGIFIIPEVKNSQLLSREQRTMSYFFEYSKKYPLIQSFLGIKATVLEEHKTLVTSTPKRFFYSTFAMFKVSEAIPQPLANIHPLDREKIAIHTFNKAIVPDFLVRIENDAYMSRAVATVSSIYNGDNFLNGLRAPRFMMIALTNLLWNLQHPIDPKDDFPYTVAMCIKLCYSALGFTNELLDEENPIRVSLLNNDKNELISFVRIIDTHIKALLSAYIDKKSNEINVMDLVTQAHKTLRIIDSSIMKFIYAKKDVQRNTITYDNLAADKMAHGIYLLNTLLGSNLDLFDLFDAYQEIVPGALFLNKPAQTFIDILIIFCHLSSPERRDLIRQIRASKFESAQEFSDQLYLFDRQFIKPIKDVSKKELNTHSGLVDYYREIACLTARRLIPMITLLIEDYKLDLTIENVNKLNHFRQRKIYSGSEQVNLINEHAYKELLVKYYEWKLSPYLGVHEKYSEQINELPMYQYTITKMNRLLEKLAEIIEYYRTFLQYKYFQKKLIERFNKIKEAYGNFKNYIEQSHEMMASGEHIRRSLKGVLNPMAEDLSNNIDAFTSLIQDITATVSAANFTDKQRALLDKKLQEIDEEYFDVINMRHSSILGNTLVSSAAARLSEPSYWNSDSPHSVVTELGEVETPPALRNYFSHRLLASRSSFEALTPSQTDLLSTQQNNMFKQLLENCIKAMSMQSYYGRKGDNLKFFLQRVQMKESINWSELKTMIYELAKHSACYREASFFQAPYAQTKTAQALMAAMKDHHVNNLIPLTKTLLPDYTGRIEDLTEQEIISGLETLRASHHWCSSVNEIGAVLVS